MVLFPDGAERFQIDAAAVFGDGIQNVEGDREGAAAVLQRNQWAASLPQQAG